MAYLTYKAYKKKGGVTVAKGEFERWQAMAEAHVRLYTSGRLDDTALTSKQKRGMVEIIDLLHNDGKQLNRRLMSFSNGQYTETYGLPSRTTTMNTQQEIGALLRLYFTQAQLYRGV
ncbi:MAG: hypothetical protein FWE06_07930 [Oscillospiraceae bacterium]|nr:hypothetical protein [Oscillospiraceae bacterium]